MAHKLILEDTIIYPSKAPATIQVEVVANGCNVILPTQNGRIEFLTWEHMQDSELMANVFADETVRTLRVIMELLEKVYVNRHLYKALL